MRHTRHIMIHRPLSHTALAIHCGSPAWMCNSNHVLFLLH